MPYNLPVIEVSCFRQFVVQSITVIVFMGYQFVDLLKDWIDCLEAPELTDLFFWLYCFYFWAVQY